MKQQNDEVLTMQAELDIERSKIVKLDQQIAQLKDEKAELEQANALLIQQQKNIANNFQLLWNTHNSLLDDVVNTTLALTISAGKLSESSAKHRLTIPDTANITTNNQE